MLAYIFHTTTLRKRQKNKILKRKKYSLYEKKDLKMCKT